MLIVVGSLSEIKYTGTYDAVHELTSTATIITVDVKSEVSPIPQGMAETFLGASNRARNSTYEVLAYENDLFIGIESGLIFFETTLPPVDITICAVCNRDRQIISVGTSTGLMFPVHSYKEAMSKDINSLYKKGAIIETGDPSDPHFEISNRHRSAFVKEAVWSALLHVIK